METSIIIKIRTEVLTWNGVTALPHRFGGIEFRFGKREVGHMHGDYLVDIPFPMKIHDDLITKGIVEKHHILPDSGWISFYIKEDKDIETAIALFRKSYDLAFKQKQKRKISDNQRKEFDQ